jgi:hypothetical protein
MSVTCFSGLDTNINTNHYSALAAPSGFGDGGESKVIMTLPRRELGLDRQI